MALGDSHEIWGTNSWFLSGHLYRLMTKCSLSLHASSSQKSHWARDVMETAGAIGAMESDGVTENSVVIFEQVPLWAKVYMCFT